MAHVSLSAPGMLAARFLKADHAGAGDLLAAAGFAEGKGWGADGTRLGMIFRSAVNATSLADLTDIFGPVSVDLNAFSVTRSVLLRLPGLRRVPQGIRIVSGTNGADATFLRRGAPIRIGQPDLTSSALPLLKIAAARVVSRELLRAGPSTDGLPTNSATPTHAASTSRHSRQTAWALPAKCQPRSSPRAARSPLQERSMQPSPR